MLKFELKKLKKSKIFLITIFLSLIMSLYINYYSNNVFSLDTKYKYYEEVPAEFYFNYIASSQAHKLENKDAFYDEFQQSSQKALRENYSKLKEFLTNKKTKSFKEMYDQSEFVQMLDFNQLQDIKRFMEVYNFVIDDERVLKTFEYGILESEYYHDNDIRFTKRDEEILTTNYNRRIIYNSRLIFGIPFVIFLILIFYGTISKEKDDGTINILNSQPISNRKLIFSKFAAMILLSVFYIFSFLFIFLLVSYIQGVNILEFRDIFRVFTETMELKYIKGYILLPLILISFLVMIAFYSSIIILINIISKTKEDSLSILLVIFGLGYTITENVKFLQSVYNPLYTFDHVRNINGMAREIVKNDGTRYIENLNQSSLIYLAFYLLLAFIILEISIFVFSKKLRFKENENYKAPKSYNFWIFEIRKIIKNKSFYIYLLGALIFVSSLYFFKFNEVNEKLSYMIGENGEISLKENELKTYQEQLKLAKNEFEIEILNSKIELVNEKIRLLKSRSEGYKSGNSKEFYNSQKEISLYNFDTYAIPQELLKYSSLSPFSRVETKLLDEYSANNNIKPVLRESFKYTDYEKFDNQITKNMEVGRTLYLTNSYAYSNFRMLKYQNLDILFLVLILFMVLGGYTYDKENGDQISMIYTQPINKFNYHILKILTQSIVAVGVYIIIILFIIFIAILSEGIGELNQPIIEYLSFYKRAQSAIEGAALETISVIPIYLYLIRITLIIIFQSLLISSVSTLISIYTRSKVLMIGIIGVIFTSGAVLTNVSGINIIKLISPFSYISASNIADNSITAINEIAGTSFIKSILMLTIWTIIISIFGGFLAKKKEQI